jgi:DNA invertase Pin-like site-specific DNA recombinase
MTQKNNGRAVFYTRDSGGKHEQTPAEYLRWAQKRAKELGVAFDGTPDTIEAMTRDGSSQCGDIYLDYNVCGNVLSREGLDALVKEVTGERGVTHVLIPRRDRLARPNDPIDGIKIETLIRKCGTTIVFMDKVCPPLAKGKRRDIGESIVAFLDYENAGAFRREHAQKMLMAQVNLARNGFATGGRPPYGFRRWLVTKGGERVRELQEGERVRQAGHHVVWLPGPEEELAVIRRILAMLEEMPASTVAKILTLEGIPTPDSGRYRTDNGVRHQTSGVWHQTTIVNIARNPLLVAIASYGRRSMGDQLRYTPDGPRELSDSDYHPNDLPRVIRNPAGSQTEAPAKFEPLVDPERHRKLLQRLDDRAGTQRGKPRSRDPSKNPLGGRVFDMNCSWPMYRSPYGKGFKYKCGYYLQSHGQKCAHNHVDGPLATRFMLSVIQQRLLSPTMLPRLEQRLRRLAAQDGDKRPDDRDDVAVKRAEAKEVARQLEIVSGNLALAESPAQHKAIAKMFNELEAKQKRLEEELSAMESRASGVADQEGEI